jgi:hypothetical protein
MKLTDNQKVLIQQMKSVIVTPLTSVDTGTSVFDSFISILTEEIEITSGKLGSTLHVTTQEQATGLLTGTDIDNLQIHSYGEAVSSRIIIDLDKIKWGIGKRVNIINLSSSGLYAVIRITGGGEVNEASSGELPIYPGRQTMLEATNQQDRWFAEIPHVSNNWQENKKDK